MNMKKNKKDIISSLKINSTDVGSSEVQIGLLSEKINHLTEHFKKNKNDKHSTRGLIKAVNLRKRLLEYLKRNNSDSYKNILSKLNLRK
jgi:small subunit ribosomal protein S15